MLASNKDGQPMIDENGHTNITEPTGTDDLLDNETASVWKALYHLLKGLGCFTRID